MSGERNTLAAAMRDRKVYSFIATHLKQPDLTEQGRVVWEAIDQYYRRDGKAQSVDAELLTKLIESTVANPKHKEALATVVSGLARVEISPENWAEHLVGMRREAVGAKLASAILSGDKADELLEEFVDLTGAEVGADEERPRLLMAPSLRDVLSETPDKDLIALYPRALNARIGDGMMRGHHVIIFARPEMGKTTFLANIAAGCLHDGHRVLYLGNEEPLADLVAKFKGRVARRTRYEVVADMDGTDALCRERGWDNMAMAQLELNTPREIEEYVQEIRPDVLIIDQLRNINVRGSKNDGFVQNLEAAAKAVRQIGLKYNCLVISATQAGDSASGKSVLDMSDVADSKTGIPAQADLMIGIGATSEDEMAARRVLSLPKNKRSGRHDHFPVGVNLAIGTWSSMEQ